MGHITDSILRLHGLVALTIIFLVPALEASAFLGFLVPGEIAVLLGGVLAYQGRGEGAAPMPLCAVAHSEWRSCPAEERLRRRVAVWPRIPRSR